MSITFSLNGSETNVPLAEAGGMTLNDYLRFHSTFKGTKIGCGQGGCGACTVVVSERLLNGEVRKRPVPSCLFPLCELDGAAVTTVEGLAKEGSPHPIQTRIASFNGSQCGFCTPGMVMATYAALSRLDGGKGCTSKELASEDVLGGNLCRCTGYRPLEEAVQSFANDTTITDQIDGSSVGSYDTKSNDPEFPKFLATQKQDRSWKPCTMDTLLKSWKLLCGNQFQLVNGHTGWGVYGNKLEALQPGLGAEGVASESTNGFPLSASSGSPVLHVRSVPELQAIQCAEGSLKIGAAVTIACLIAALDDYKGPGKLVATGVRDHLHLIAGHQVRNTGSVVGNLMMARNLGFASDVAPVLSAIGTTVTLFANGDTTSSKTIPLYEFLLEDEEKTGPVLVTSFTLPLTGAKDKGERRFHSFRSALRSRNAYSLLNAAFCLDLDQSGKIARASAVYGALGRRPTVARAERLERALVACGSLEALSEKAVLLVEAARGDAEDGGWHKDEEHGSYRLRQAQTFAFKLAQQSSSSSESTEAGRSIHARGCRSSGGTHSQNFPPISTDPLESTYKPMIQTTAVSKTTGDVKFTDDMPIAAHSVYGAMVCIPEANALLNGLDDSDARQSIGSDFVAFITAGDLQNGALPLKYKWSIYLNFTKEKNHDVLDENIFLPLGDRSSFAGQCVALVLAKTRRAAERASSLVSIDFTPDREGIIIDNETAPAIEGDPIVCKAGDPAKIKKILAEHEAKGGKVIRAKYGKTSQHHFYMETQSAIAIPDEDEGMTVWASSQALDLLHEALSIQTKIPCNKLRTKCRRVGGAFGGKMIGCINNAVKAAIAAKLINVPVRMMLPRDKDTANFGGRHELTGSYAVAIDEDGKIVAMDMDLKWNLGYQHGINKLIAAMMGQNVDMCYALNNVVLTITCTSMHTPQRSFVRGPGHYEATSLIEAVMDTIATSLQSPPELVRKVNLVRDRPFKLVGLAGPLVPGVPLHENPLQAMWNDCLEKADMVGRRKAVAEYNSKHRWKKRGLSISPGKYGLMRMPGMPARVDIFKDGSIQVAASGGEIGQGLHTKVAQSVATALSKGLQVVVPVSAIHFTDFATDVLPNHKFAGGSTTSELAIFAAEEACKRLIKRFKTLKAKKKALKRKKDKLDDSELNWNDLVKAAYDGEMSHVANLTSDGMAVPGISDMLYDVFGCAVGEVEVDVLTGEVRILSVTLVMDSGPVLNPAIEIGQVEGAFMFGVGGQILEKVQFDSKTGENLSTNTWTYKIPSLNDLPQEFKIHLEDFHGRRAGNGWGAVFSLASCLLPQGSGLTVSKIAPRHRSARSMGEPPVLMSACIHSALRQAISAARVNDANPAYCLPLPAMAEDVAELSWGHSHSLAEIINAPDSTEVPLHNKEGDARAEKGSSFTSYAMLLAAVGVAALAVWLSRS